MREGMNMVSNNYKLEVESLIEKAKNKKLVENYSRFCNTNIGQKTRLTENEIMYYTSKKGESK